MQTKHLTIPFLLLFLFITIEIHAQNWAPIGATWHYTKSYEYPPYLKSFSKITSVKDTVINSINCRKLIRYKPGVTGTPNVYSDILYMYELNRKVYYFVGSLNRFCLLYDFNANAGGWWILDEFPASWGDTVKVISTGTIIINGYQKKTMILTNTCAQYGFGGNAIEGIGSLDYMFPTFDMNTDGPLRCYQDNTIGLYVTGEAPTCETTTIGIQEYPDNDNITIYPNPAEKVINVWLDGSNKNVVINLIDSKGRVLNTTKTDKEFETLDISTLPSGIYIMQMVFADRTVNRKIQISK